VPEATPAEPKPRRRDRAADAVGPFASRPYRLMWMGSTVSSLGDALVQIALVFAILQVGGTASDIGIVAAVKTIAQIAFLLAGGVWADRLRRQYVIAAGFVVLRYKPKRPLVAADLLATGLALPLIALGLSHSVAVIAAANAWFGFELIISNTLWYTTMQTLVPDNVRARVDSYDWLVSMVIMPIGYLVAGPLSSSIGFTSTLVAAGAISAIPCSLVVLLPGIRGVHRNPAGGIVGPGGVDPVLTS
jgi:MFS family permease